VRTELPTLDSSTSTNTLDLADVFEFFFCMLGYGFSSSMAFPDSNDIKIKLSNVKCFIRFLVLDFELSAFRKVLRLLPADF